MIKPRRIRAVVVIDRDAVSPDSISAANEYLLRSLEELADRHQVAIDWNTWRCYTHRRLRGEMRMTQFARTIR